MIMYTCISFAELFSKTWEITWGLDSCNINIFIFEEGKSDGRNQAIRYKIEIMREANDAADR